MKKIFLAAACAIGALGALAPAAAHTTVVLAPGQMLGGGTLFTPAGAIADPRYSDGVATDGTLVFTNLDSGTSSVAVRKCLTAACTTFELKVNGTVRIEHHAVANFATTDVPVSRGFASHVGRYLVTTNAPEAATGVFRVTSTEG